MSESGASGGPTGADPGGSRPRPPELDERLRYGLTVGGFSLLILVLLYLILRELAHIFQPLLIAVFLCYLIVPAHRWLVRRGLPSLLSYVVIVGVVFGAAYGVGRVVAPGVTEMSSDLEPTVRKIVGVIDDTFRRIKESLQSLAPAVSTERLPGDADAAAAAQSAEESESGSAADESAAAPGGESSEESSFKIFSQEQVLGVGQWVLGGILGIAGGFFRSALVVLFFVVFLLLEQAGFGKRLANAFGAKRAGRIFEVITTINIAVSRYISVKAFVSTLIGVITTGVLMLFGVKYALMWGLLTFLLNFIPYIGSMIAVALPSLYSVAQFNGDLLTPAVIAAILFIAQQFTGSILEPRLLGQKLGVSPLMILLSLAFWGVLWGIPGAILSAPLIVSIKIILENIEQTKPIARLISHI